MLHVCVGLQLKPTLTLSSISLSEVCTGQAEIGGLRVYCNEPVKRFAPAVTTASFHFSAEFLQSFQDIVVESYLAHSGTLSPWRVDNWDVVFVDRALAIYILEVVRVATYVRDKGSVHN